MEKLVWVHRSPNKLLSFMWQPVRTCRAPHGGLRCSDTCDLVVDFLYDSFIYNDSGECRAT